jgi:oligoendopeptidase F
MGEGFFDAYEGGPVSYPPELLELFTKENRLLMSYSGAMADLYVEYEGEHYTEADIADLEGDERYPEVVQAYEEKYNRILGETYVELVAVRQQIAEIFGYADYADYAYETLHQREFTPQQAKAHLNRVKETLAPVCRSVFATDSTYKLYAMSTDRIMDATDEILKAMSKDLSDIYVEMRNKRLYTVGASDRMYNGSFQTYFNRYDTPYLFVNGTGGTIDILSVLHEFGHFSSAYYNYGVTGSLDESEVASQALELLSLRHLRTTLSEVEVVPLEEYIIERFLALYVEQAAQAAFEDLVYADEDLTLEECNDYYAQCLADFGLASRSEGREDCWVFINHFFEMPYYIISYSVAADVAVQLYELGEGQSVETYLNLIACAHRRDFLGNLAEVGLTDPLDESRPEAMAAFFSREIKR